VCVFQVNLRPPGGQYINYVAPTTIQVAHPCATWSTKSCYPITAVWHYYSSAWPQMLLEQMSVAVPGSKVIQLYLPMFCVPRSSLLSASVHNYLGLSGVFKKSLMCLLRAHWLCSEKISGLVVYFYFVLLRSLDGVGLLLGLYFLSLCCSSSHALRVRCEGIYSRVIDGPGQCLSDNCSTVH